MSLESNKETAVAVILTVLTSTLSMLKIAGFIKWSWWLVTAAIWVPLSLFIIWTFIVIAVSRYEV